MRVKKHQDTMLKFNSGVMFLSDYNGYYTDLIKV